MHIVKGILGIILILVLVIVGLCVANILTSSSSEEDVIYHLIIYNNSTDEILEEWESHDIRVYEEDNYVVFINNADDGRFYQKRLLNDKNQIRYTLEERREKR